MFMFDLKVIPVLYGGTASAWCDFCHIALSCLGAGAESIDNWVHSGLSSFIAPSRRYEE